MLFNSEESVNDSVADPEIEMVTDLEQVTPLDPHKTKNRK